MKVCGSDRKLSALVVILTINSFCAFSQNKIPHEIIYLVSCFYNGTSQIHYELDGEEVVYMDFDTEEVVYTVPRFLVDDPTKLFEGVKVFRNAHKNKNLCLAINTFLKTEEGDPPENTEPPESILYPSEEVELEVENTLICLVDHFYPPHIEVNWTKNDHPVSEGVSLSRYYSNNDRTFRQFSTLTFTPREGDIYSCTVEHIALDRPKTRIWDVEFSHHSRSLGPDVYCGVGLTLGLLGVAAGTFLMVKGHHRQ